MTRLVSTIGTIAGLILVASCDNEPARTAPTPQAIASPAAEPLAAASGTRAFSAETSQSAPVGRPDRFGGSQGRSLHIPKPGVLGNDYDPDSDTISAAIVEITAYSTEVCNQQGYYGDGPCGELTLNPDGSFHWEPLPHWTGTQTFTYQVTDGTLSSAPVTVTLTTFSTADVPKASLDVELSSATAPATAVLDGSLSSDPKGVAIKVYNWFFGDGRTATTSTPSVSHTYSSPGTYIATLYVTNADGLSSDPVHSSLSVVKTPTAPTAPVQPPKAGFQLKPTLNPPPTSPPKKTAPTPSPYLVPKTK